MAKGTLYTLLLCVFFGFVIAPAHSYYKIPSCIAHDCCRDDLRHRFLGFLSDLVRDTVAINLNLFSVTTAKVVTLSVPFFLTTRTFDEKFHKRFYDKNCHKNINQMNSTASNALEKLPFCGVLAFSSLSLLATEEELRQVSRLFAIGALSSSVGKDLIKGLEAKHNIRPWKAEFSDKKRAYGGFPSGHMIEASYMATVLGSYYGLKAAIPLGLLTAATFAVVVNSNRHYISQAVAGISVGIIYGLATTKVINKRLSEQWSFDCGAGNKGDVQFKFCYNF